MKEDFLHYIWNYQDFNTIDLHTTTGEEVTIIQKGFHNHDSGPDFSEGRIKIGNVNWAGNIEIHIKSSDWHLHKHQEDAAYDNVILHVVWEEDIPIITGENRRIPTIELKNRVNSKVLSKYRKLLSSKSTIACEKDFLHTSELKQMAMLDAALARRMERKAAEVLAILEQNTGNWEQTAYQLLLRNFGFKLNNEAFERLARSMPLAFLQKQLHEPIMVEALLFGQAGFLDAPSDEYAKTLKQHYDFQSAKFSLQETKLLRSQWKFMRTRPGNFPTVRLAQLLSFLIENKSIMSLLMDNFEIDELAKKLRVLPNSYWQRHYDFGKEQTKGKNQMGKASFYNLVINTLVPLLVAYGKYIDDQDSFEKAMSLLETIPAEENRITKTWKKLKLPIKNMQDSQGAIEQYNEFCSKLRCMECTVGVGILRK
ncbi:Protein of unknown function [Spirosomataceae bacterium TFI 002]|nr:Protein of unknown function [Spirosomataceae bacterium TFI 002]